MRTLLVASLILMLNAHGALSDSDVNPLSQLGRLLSFQFPKDAVADNYQHEKGMDDQWVAKIRMTAGGLEAFLKSESLRAAKWDRPKASRKISYMWWNPGALSAAKATQIRLKDGKVANIVHGYDQPAGSWVIYIQVFET
jgi:hypothetical protein